MHQTMLIETNPYQVRVAILRDGELRDLAIERLHESDVVGYIYKGRVKRVLPGMEAAFVDLGLSRDGYLAAGDLPDPDTDSAEDDPDPEPLPIQERLRPGDAVLVQVEKQLRAGKGPRVSARIGLPGRLLVWMPYGRGLSISRKIEDEDERQRLLELMDRLDAPQGGLIARTAAAGCGFEPVAADFAKLRQRWEEIRTGFSQLPTPSLLWEEEELVLRSVRDLLRSDIDRLIVDGPEAMQRIRDYLQRSAPGMLERLESAENPGFLFEQFGVEDALERAQRRRVYLPSGGHIIIQHTEALVAIDVNTGRHVGKRRLEETVLQTNLESASEIARQIRIRDLGGLIVVDFIDLQEQQNRTAVIERLQEELSGDRQSWRMSELSEFGLLQITRRRARADLNRLLSRPCPTCHGRGMVQEPLTTCLRLRRDLMATHVESGDQVQVSLHPGVLQAMEQKLELLRQELEGLAGGRLTWHPDSELKHHEYRIERLS